MPRLAEFGRPLSHPVIIAQMIISMDPPSPLVSRLDTALPADADFDSFAPGRHRQLDPVDQEADDLLAVRWARRLGFPQLRESTGQGHHGRPLLLAEAHRLLGEEEGMGILVFLEPTEGALPLVLQGL